MPPLLLPDGRPGDSKEAWRGLGRRRRAALSAARSSTRDAGWTRVGIRAIAGLGLTTGSPGTVALYLSRPREPGTLRLAENLFAGGVHVLAPLLTDGAGHRRHEPAWAWYQPTQLRDGLWGIPEPSSPELPDALSRADLVICSALWVDRAGHRVGAGGGWYDRALAARLPGVPVWAMVDDSELVPLLPRDPWDLAVDAALTPTALVPLGAYSPGGTDQ